jgi:hypothetical protein
MGLGKNGLKVLGGLDECICWMAPYSMLQCCTFCQGSKNLARIVGLENGTFSTWVFLNNKPKSLCQEDLELWQNYIPSMK